MKKILMFTTLILTGIFAASASAELKINLGVVTKPGSAQNIAAEKFKELVEQRSGKAISDKIHHSASL